MSDPEPDCLSDETKDLMFNELKHSTSSLPYALDVIRQHLQQRFKRETSPASAPYAQRILAELEAVQGQLDLQIRDRKATPTEESGRLDPLRRHVLLPALGPGLGSCPCCGTVFGSRDRGPGVQ